MNKNNRQWHAAFVILGAIVAIAFVLPGHAVVTAHELPPIPNSVGVAGPFAGIANDALLVAGGANFPEAPPWEDGEKVWHDAVYLLPAPGGAWEEVGKLPRPLAYGVSVSTDRGVFCIGGGDAGRHYAETFFLQWDGAALTTTTGPPLPRPVAFGCGVLSGNTVYMLGGHEQPDAPRPLHTCWSLDLADLDAGWKERAPWPGPPRMLAVAGAHGGKVYLFAGVDLVPDESGDPTRDYLTDAWRLDPDAGWTPLPAMPVPSAAAPTPAPVYQDRLYVLGGDTGRLYGTPPGPDHPGFVGNITAYDVAKEIWLPEGRLPKRPEDNVRPPVTTTPVRWHGGYVLPSGEVRPGIRSPQVLMIEFGPALVHARR